MKSLPAFIALLATLAAAAYAEHKPEPKPCLTSGCKKLTTAYDLASMGAAIGRAAEHQRVYTFQPQTLPVRHDPTGFFVGSPAFQESAGGKSCYDATQRITMDQFNLLKGIITQLKQNYYSIPDFYWTVLLVRPVVGCVNSNSIPTYGEVNFFTSMGRALSWDRDAIACVIAHEIGHLTDKYCGTLGQNITATAGSTALQQVCEKHADNIGIQYVIGAGFNPNGFIKMFQRMQQLLPKATDNVSTRYSSNHPIDRDRITNVGLAVDELCKENIPGACQYARGFWGLEKQN
jgi:hypothetical protein